jgi:hypothetical protein
VKLGDFSEIARLVEEEEFRGLEFVTRGKRRVLAVRVQGRYLECIGDRRRPLAMTIELATRPCWRPTNDV